MPLPLFLLISVLIVATPAVNSPGALILGFILSTLNWVPKDLSLGVYVKKLLALSIIGLGFGIQFEEALATTSNGLGLIVASIIATLVLGIGIGKLLKLDSELSYLIASGTAICGGSAIAAVSTAIKAKQENIGLALAVVFVLNSLALFIFPVIGHALSLTQNQFGYWAAIAIHDTSSVVGAASAYGEEALKTATTVKLARALWIIPLALVSTWIMGKKNAKVTLPLFIVGYCLAIVVSDFTPQFQAAYDWIFIVAKRLLVLSLFWVGASISIKQIRAAGANSMVLGVILWALISVGSLVWIVQAY